MALGVRLNAGRAPELMAARCSSTFKAPLTLGSLRSQT